MKWEKVKLSEVTEYITDGDHQPAPKSDSGVLFVKIKDIQDNRLTFDNALFVPQEYYNQLPKNRKAVYGDTLYTVVGSYGIPAFVNHNIPFCFERNIALLHPNNRVIPKYLYYAVKNPIFYGNANNIANGSAQKLIPLSKLAGMEVSVPPIERQETIVNILSAYDELIENNQKQIKLLEEAAQRLYKEWFVDLRFPGHETTPIVDGVPEGWKEQSLYQIADVVMGQSPKSEYYNQVGEGLPFHQGVGSYGNRFVSDETYSTSFTRIAEAGSILFSVRAPVGRLNLTKNKVVIGRGLAAINHRRGAQSYLFYLLKEKFFRDDIIGNGSIFASISKEELLNQTFLIPIDSLVGQFNGIAGGIDKKIDILSEQIRLLTEARNRLLPKLMSGEIEV